MKNIAIMFDIDDTVYDQIQPFERALKKVLGDCSNIDMEGLFQQFIKRGHEVFAASESGEMSLHDSRVYRVTMAMKDYQIPFNKEMAEEFQREYLENQGKLEMSKLMEEIIDFSVKNFEITGVVSNGPGEHQLGKMKALGIERWIPREKIIVSGYAGMAKPDIRIFKIAQEQCKTSGRDVYMLGDSWNHDIEGAHAAGWKTIWFNRHHKELPENYKIADFIVNSEKELLEVLQKLSEM